MQLGWSGVKCGRGRPSLGEPSILCAMVVLLVWASLHRKLEGFLQGHIRWFAWVTGLLEQMVCDILTSVVRKTVRGMSTPKGCQRLPPFRHNLGIGGACWKAANPGHPVTRVFLGGHYHHRREGKGGVGPRVRAPGSLVAGTAVLPGC